MHRRDRRAGVATGSGAVWRSPRLGIAVGGCCRTARSALVVAARASVGGSPRSIITTGAITTGAVVSAGSVISTGARTAISTRTVASVPITVAIPEPSAAGE
jgi:hypothetical protein